MMINQLNPCKKCGSINIAYDTNRCGYNTGLCDVEYKCKDCGNAVHLTASNPDDMEVKNALISAWNTYNLAKDNDNGKSTESM